MRAAPAPSADPIALVQQYLLWHTVTICGGRCLLCDQALAYLRTQNAVPPDVDQLLPHDGLPAIARAQDAFGGLIDPSGH